MLARITAPAHARAPALSHRSVAISPARPRPPSSNRLPSAPHLPCPRRSTLASGPCATLALQRLSPSPPCGYKTPEPSLCLLTSPPVAFGKCHPKARAPLVRPSRPADDSPLRRRRRCANPVTECLWSQGTRPPNQFYFGPLKSPDSAISSNSSRNLPRRRSPSTDHLRPRSWSR